MRKVMRVLEARVHPETSCGWQLMGGIAHQHNPSVDKFFGHCGVQLPDPFMHYLYIALLYLH